MGNQEVQQMKMVVVVISWALGVFLSMIVAIIALGLVS
jgi:hypothetical protein